MSGERGDPGLGAVAVLEELPRLDEVALGILEVERVVAAVVLDRAAVLDAELAQPVADREQLAVADREREVHVAPAAVAELLLAWRPQAEPRLLAAAEPHAVALVGQLREREDVG